MHNFSIKSLCKNNNLTVLTPHPCGCSSSPVDTSPHGISCTTFYMHKTGRNIIFSFYTLLLCIFLDTCVLISRKICYFILCTLHLCLNFGLFQCLLVLGFCLPQTVEPWWLVRWWVVLLFWFAALFVKWYSFMISLNKGMVLLFLIRCCLFALGLLLVMCLLEFTKVSVRF